MPRVIHKPIIGVVQHVISRFVNGYRLMDSDEIRGQYLARLGTVLAESDWRLLWYALMETHIHLALIAGASLLKSWLQPLHTGFAVWLNLCRRKRGIQSRGPVFAALPKTVNFSHEKAGYLAAYLHNNPVRAGVVQNAADSTWTSHRAYIGLDPVPSFLHVNRGLALTGNDFSPSGRLSFHDYVVARSGDPRDARLSGGEISAVRNSERQRQGPIVEMRSPYLAIDKTEYETLLMPEAHIRYSFEENAESFLCLVAGMTGVSVAQMRSTARDRCTVSARRTAILAWRALNRATSEIAASLSIGAPAATQLVRRKADYDLDAKQNSDLIVSFCEKNRKVKL
jgi:hypothetical protein